MVGIFSVWPGFALLEPGEAIVSLSFSHAGQRVGECRQLTQQELERLAPNMRKPSDCPRERHDVFVSFAVDDAVLYQQTLPPSGIWRDGKSNIYQRLTLDAGEHRFRIVMNDSGTAPVANHERDLNVTLRPQQNLLISFDGLQQQFVFD